MTNLSRAEWAEKAWRMHEAGHDPEAIALAVKRSVRTVYDVLDTWRRHGPITAAGCNMDRESLMAALWPAGKARGTAVRCPLHSLTDAERAAVQSAVPWLVEMAMLSAMKRAGVPL